MNRAQRANAAQRIVKQLWNRPSIVKVGVTAQDAALAEGMVAWYVRGFITKTDVSLIFAAISTPEEGTGRRFRVADAKYDRDDAVWTVTGQGGLVAIIEEGTIMDPLYVRHKGLVDADPRLAASALAFAGSITPEGSVELTP